MAVCALTMLDGMEAEVTAAGGVLLLFLALILAWLSTHVADRGDHILGTILTVGAHASLIGLGGHDNYSAGAQSPDTSEQQAPAPPQENKSDEGEPASERGEGEDAEGRGTDLLLDIRSKQPQAAGLLNSDEDDDYEEEDDDEELEDENKSPAMSVPVVTSTVTPTTVTTASISIRLKFLNDTEELAVVEPEDTVGLLKSKYFSGREHQIKLIYQGQLLQDPKKTFLALKITHNSVIHCHVSPALPEPSPEDGAESGAGTGAGFGGLRAASVAISTSSLVVPVFVVVLAVVWYFRIIYRQFFTAPATISLVGVTVFFSFLIFGMHSR